MSWGYRLGSQGCKMVLQPCTIILQAHISLNKMVSAYFFAKLLYIHGKIKNTDANPGT
jgi:hypothetical protein